MRFADWLLLWTLALAWYGVGCVWLVQLVAWPLFGFVGRNEFAAYHQRWWDGIKIPILVPGTLAFAGGIGLLFARPAAVPVALIGAGVAMEIVVYLLTAFWYGPQQARLHDTSSPVFARLKTAHWVRTALLSGYGLVLLAAVVLRIGAA